MPLLNAGASKVTSSAYFLSKTVPGALQKQVIENNESVTHLTY